MTMLGWVFVPFYYKSGMSTMPDFLERRFGGTTRGTLSPVSFASTRQRIQSKTIRPSVSMQADGRFFALTFVLSAQIKKPAEPLGTLDGPRVSRS